MNSVKESFLFAAVKTMALAFAVLPMRLNLWLARRLGGIAYCFLSRKRQVVYANLKTVFAATRMPSQIRKLTKEVFRNLAQSAVELLCLPQMKRLGFEKSVEVQGKEHISQALQAGRGVIFLAVHSGSWELASVVGGLMGAPYHEVVNAQSKIPALDKMLNECRTVAGAHVITAQRATKEILKAIQRNEIISLVLDQGGRSGLVVPFLGKTSSVSTGAVRLALKYGTALCPVWIERHGDRHLLKIFGPLALSKTGHTDADLHANVLKAVAHFEPLMKEHPQEYMWFYKVFKYSQQAKVLILDDGRIGHLRQSQSVARHLKEVLRRKGKTAEETVISLQWKSKTLNALFSSYACISQYSSLMKVEESLGWFLTKACYGELMKHKADYIISCGSQAAGVNFILSRNHLSKSISVMTPGHIAQRRFHAVVLPQHDKIQNIRHTSLIVPKVSPNLINPAYLKDQREGLLRQFPHLKGSVRMKFGVLIGGNAKGVVLKEAAIRQLVDQIKDAASHYKADIVLTTSRRTPPAVEQAIAGQLKDFDRCALCVIANQRNVPNAVGGILEMSDLVIVSGESVSMISESLSAGKRTIVFSPHGRYGDKPRDKYEEFVLRLEAQGYLMATSIDGIKVKIAHLLSHKITLQPLDDHQVIQKGLQAIV